MHSSKLDTIIQESINNGVALKLLKNISSELSSSLKPLEKIASNVNMPKDVSAFAKKLYDFTVNVINAIKRCVSANSLDEANEMVRVSQMNIDPLRFINRLGGDLYSYLSRGGILGNVGRNGRIGRNHQHTNAYGITLKVLMGNIYPKIKKEYSNVDAKYSCIFSQAKSSDMLVPMRTINKMEEIINIMQNAQGSNP